MREDESNWFSKWENELPSLEELIPLSQTLISPDLALAFNIQNPQFHHPLAAPAAPQPPNSAEFDSSELGGAESTRSLKRPRLVWTPQLHKRFVEAVAHLGIKNAVPKTIMQLMSVEGLTRENVASHLQKYRLYLKRMQGIGSGVGGDPATDRLFASSPVPPNFLRPSSDLIRTGPSASYVDAAAMQQQRYLPHRPHLGLVAQFGQIGQFGGQMENPFLDRQEEVHDVHRFGATNVDSGRKVLTLFPTRED